MVAEYLDKSPLTSTFCPLSVVKPDESTEYLASRIYPCF